MKRKQKSLIAIIVIMSMFISLALPNFATGNDDKMDNVTTQSTEEIVKKSDEESTTKKKNIVEEETTKIEVEESTTKNNDQIETTTTEVVTTETTKENSNAKESTVAESEKEQTTTETTVESTTTEKNNNEDIATKSEAYTEIASAEKTGEEEDYSKLSTLDQLTYITKDGAKLENDTIVLLSDIELYDKVNFTNNLNLDLAGHNITAPKNNYALYVEKNFTLIDTSEEKGSIKGVNTEYPVIYLKNALASFNGGNVLGASKVNGGDAIHSYNSDLIFDGSLIKGGNGEDSNSDKGGNGGNAVVVFETFKTNFIQVKSGVLRGGKGGNGIGDEMPDAGASLSIRGLMQNGRYSGKGFIGEKGGGNGGIGLDIRAKKFEIEKLTFEKFTLYAGSAGHSIVKSEQNTNRLMGDDGDSFPSSYSLFDLNGRNYLTTLKNQSYAGLCAIYAFCAQAETYMMKNHPDYVRNVLNKKAYMSRGVFPNKMDELNLSEIQCAMSLHKPATDAFGNAGYSDATKEADRAKWKSLGSTYQNQLAIASSWRTFVLEDDTMSDNLYTDSSYDLLSRKVERSYVDSFADKTIVHANNMRLFEAFDYVKEDNSFDYDNWIKDMKREIVNYDGVSLGIYIDYSPSIGSYSLNGIPYPYSDSVFYVEKRRTSLSGHGVYCIGWDDDFEYTGSYGVSHKGAFIVKNSWNEFSFVPYNYNWVNWYNADPNVDPPNLTSEFYSAEFMPAFSKYENNYYYDTGVSGVSKNSRIVIDDKPVTSEIKADLSVAYKKALNVFKVRNDREKAVAVNFYASFHNKPYEVSLYRVPNDTNEDDIANAINNESNKLTSQSFTSHYGINVIDFDNPVDLKKDTYVAVVITGEDDNLGRLWIDGEGVEEIDLGDFYHTTDVKEKGFFAEPTVTIKKLYRNNVEVTGAEFNTLSNTYANTIKNSLCCYKITDVNLRIKLYTNNYVKIDAGSDGLVVGNQVCYYYPTLKATMSDLPLPTLTNESKKFIGYNTKADGSGKFYDRDSVYSLKIADYLKLYAQYTNKEEPAQATTASTEASTTASTVASTTPSSEATTAASTEATTTTRAASTQTSTIAPAETSSNNRNSGNNGGNNGGGGGGGGGGGKIAAPLQQQLPQPLTNNNQANGNYVKSQINTNNIEVKSYTSKTSNWVTDSATGKWKLNVVNNYGQNLTASNGFYQVTRPVAINNTQAVSVTDTYFFDASGNMVTGWMNTADDKWYYFEAEKNANEGKMTIGWKKIGDSWHYFTNNGSMLVNSVTPDGYKIGADGKLVE